MREQPEVKSYRAGRAGAAAVWLAALSCGAGATAPDVFRIGLVAMPGEEAIVEGLAEIKSTYSNALGMPVEVMVARDYSALAEAQIAGRVDYAAYSAQAFAALSLRCGCIVPVAAPIDADGTVGMRSVLIVRSLPDAERGRLAVGPADSLATRLAPVASSPQAQAASSSGKLIEAPSALEAEALFVAGKVDGFFGWEPARQSDDADIAGGGSTARIANAGVDPATWRVAWRSQVLRYGPHAVRSDTPPAVIEKLAGLLERAGSDEANPGRPIMRGHDGFVRVAAPDYSAVIDAVTALGAQ